MPTMRTHPKWPARPGVEVGCDNIDCRVCYKQWFDAPLRPGEFDVTVLFRVSADSQEQANEEVTRIIEHDRFERTSVGMYLPREAEDATGADCCDLCGATIEGEPVILTSPMPARLACSECASLDATSRLNADGTRR